MPNTQANKRVILVDDESLARQRLARMLENHDGFEIVAEGANGLEAVELVRERDPDLVFLDIRMPGMDGLEAARHISKFKQPPAIIFCTAYDDYALDAFDVNAVGYILKPVRNEQLGKALTQAQKLNPLQLDSVQPETTTRSHMSVKTHAGIELIPLDEITHFQADNKYVVAFHNGREIVVDDTLKALEDQLGDDFLRIHRNCLVAKQFIQRLERFQAGQSHMRLLGVDEPLMVSRRHLSQVKATLKEL